MAANMYKIGDYVYFEISSSSPYQVRRIEELCKTQSGSVEARVMCFYRRRDISQSLATLADKHQYGGEEESETSILTNREDLSELQKHQMKHRELFLSRQVETLPATHIRGKCNVTLLNETELFTSYLNREDCFFYSLVYDPQQKTLLADKGEIRVGSRYQAEAMPLLTSPTEDTRCLSDLETLIWNPENNLCEKKVEGFQLIARSVGTFARSLDCSSTVRQPSLHMSAASASRDITLLHALDVLHESGYVVSEALQHLMPPTGPLLCRDELEAWSASEANLFDEALDKYGKDFTEIKNDFLPWKSMKSIIEYYYMWKTTDRYVQQKQLKTSEAENKLKQVYIPNYNKPNAAQINIKSDLAINQLCESCFTTQSSQWYAWGPSQMQCRVCSLCWIYWKKYGGLKMPTKLDVGGASNGEKLVPLQTNNKQFKCTIQGCTKTEFRTKVHLLQHLSSVHGVAVRPISPSVCPVMKTRAAFCLITTQLTRISRQICKHVLNIHHAARRPFHPINIALIKQECQQRLPELLSKLRILRSKSRVPMERVSARLGIDTNMDKPLLLHHHGDKVSARNTARNDNEMTGNSAEEKRLTSAVAAINVLKSNNVPTSNGKKRSYESTNGIEGPPIKQLNLLNTINSFHKTAINQIQPKIRGSALNKMTTNGFKNSKPLAHFKFRPTPDDICFIANHFTLKIRKQIRTDELRQIARHPCALKEATPILLLN